VKLGTSKIEIMEKEITYYGGLMLESPAASPLLMGVGFIVGPNISTVLFSGALTGWLLLVPISLFLNPELTAGATDTASWIALSEEIWLRQVRPIAVGTMIVAAFYTLYKLRNSLIGGISKAVSDIQTLKSGTGEVNRLEIDFDFKR